MTTLTIILQAIEYIKTLIFSLLKVKKSENQESLEIQKESQILEEPMKQKDIIPEKLFNTLFPKAKIGTLKALNSMLPEYEINTKERIAAFVSQCAHESGGFRYTEENLNYSENALLTTFGKYFGEKRNPKDFAKQPEKIANVVYASRMGNAGIKSGEGWKYRGRGFIQITGKNNYTKFQEDTGIEVLENPDKIQDDINLSLLTALWYWERHSLNSFADAEDIVGLTKKINGGTNGLEDRQQKYKEIIDSLI